MKHLRIAKMLEDRLKITELEKYIARKVHEYTKKKLVCVADFDDHSLKFAEFCKKKYIVIKKVCMIDLDFNFGLNQERVVEKAKLVIIHSLDGMKENDEENYSRFEFSSFLFLI